MMNTVVCRAPGVLVLERQEIPVRGPGEVLLRVRRVGICGTDMHIFRGTQPYLAYPRVMGHELAGEVADADPACGLKPGDPVYVTPYLACGRCAACDKGYPNACTAPVLSPLALASRTRSSASASVSATGFSV